MPAFRSSTPSSLPARAPSPRPRAPSRGCSCRAGVSRSRTQASGTRRWTAARAAVSRFGLRPVMNTRAPARTSCSRGEVAESFVGPGDEVGATGQVGEVLGVPARFGSWHDFDPTPGARRLLRSAAPPIGWTMRTRADIECWLTDMDGVLVHENHADPRRGRAAAAVARRRHAVPRAHEQLDLHAARPERAAARVRADRARGLASGPRRSRPPTSCTARCPAAPRS